METTNKRQIKRIQGEVAKATVTVLTADRGTGQGVLVNNGFIITAAHCVDFDCSGRMSLGTDSFQKIKTAHGIFRLNPYVIEPIMDIAVLGPLDDQAFPEECEEFNEFCKKTKPVSLCLDDFEPFLKFPVYIYTHKRTWIIGEAAVYVPDSTVVCTQTDHQFPGGTSGGPIINGVGELVGIVSNSSQSFDTKTWKVDRKRKSEGSSPRPHLTLPAWIFQKIQQKD